MGAPGLTLHVTRMHGGDVLNSIPGEARATIDMRGWHEADLEWAESQLLRVGPAPRRGVHDRGAPGDAAARANTAVAALAAQAAALGEALGAAVPETSTGGVSDGCWTAGAGCPRWTGSVPSARSTTHPTSTSRSRRLASRCGLVAGLVAAVDGGF